MRNKHIHIEKDSKLLKDIHKQVEENLVIDKLNFKIKIWSKFVLYFSLIVLTYWLLYIVTNPFIFVLVFVSYGFLSLLLAFNFAHDFSHNTVFKSKRLNNICFDCIYTLVGAHAQSWKQRHINSHHHAPNVEAYDSDLKISTLIRVIPNSSYYWFHRYQHIYASFAYTTYSLFWIFIKDFSILFTKDEYNLKKGLKYHFVFFIQKLFYIGFILVLPIIFSDQQWFIVLISFLMMHLLQSLFLLFTFFMTHHVEKTEYPTTDKNGYINTSWLMNQVKSSNDMHPFSNTANFILGGFNNHIAHHLFPHYHHIHYPKLNKIIYRVLIENNIEPNQTSYIGGVISHLKLLKKMSYE
ncbi:MAG: fatty acid desaturase [Flavobacteriales bacterium]|nr:fatty acid desaturase [Flavobacteriales bacterium]